MRKNNVRLSRQAAVVFPESKSEFVKCAADIFFDTLAAAFDACHIAVPLFRRERVHSKSIARFLRLGKANKLNGNSFTGRTEALTSDKKEWKK